MKKYPKKEMLRFSIGGLKVVAQIKDRGRVRLNFYQFSTETVPSFGWTFKDYWLFSKFIDYLRDVEDRFFVNYIESMPTKKEENNG